MCEFPALGIRHSSLKKRIERKENYDRKAAEEHIFNIHFLLIIIISSAHRIRFLVIILLEAVIEKKEIEKISECFLLNNFCNA